MVWIRKHWHYLVDGAKSEKQVCGGIELSSEHTELEWLERFPSEDVEQTVEENIKQKWSKDKMETQK